MAVDISKLTMGEMALVEDLAGERFAKMFEDGMPSAKGLAALALVAKRRDQLANGQAPNFSWNEAQDFTTDDVYSILGFTADEESDDAESAAPKDDSPRSKTTSRKTTAK